MLGLRQCKASAFEATAVSECRTKYHKGDYSKMQTLFHSPKQTVIEDWIDYNGHLNMAFYNVLFDRTVDHFYDHIGVGASYVKNGGSLFTLETHLHYIQELAVKDEVSIVLQLLDFDPKRLHFIELMYHSEHGYLAATSEQLAIHVDMSSRRSAPMPDTALARLGDIRAIHAQVPEPEYVGHRIGIRKSK